MRTRTAVAFVCFAFAGCNAESPTALARIDPGQLHGHFLLVFSNTTCTLEEIEMSFSQFSNGGPLPEKIRVVGSWQFRGGNFTGHLEGEITRDTGEFSIDFVSDVRGLVGIFLDNDTFAAGYTDTRSGCTARVSGKRI